jgi:hypothetical protein
MKDYCFQAEKSGFLTGAELKLSEEEKYLRVECIDRTGQRAWTNPLFLE